jgi:hypothetical protein
MSIHGYLGGVISATAPSVTTAGASGVFTLEEQLQASAQNNWPGYQISRSVRLRSSASAYLSRTFSNASTNNLKGTLSCWIKRGTLGVQGDIISCYNGSSGDSTDLIFNSSNQLQFNFGNTAANSLITTQVFQDPSAWYHIVLAVDTTQATASNRCLLYVNGVQVTSFSSATYPAQNTVFQIVSINSNNRIGTAWNNSGAFFDGYLTEVNFIDGQALTPSSFGATDAVTGVWNPIRYSGTYGNNGFYLNFSDNSGATATTIGKDYSGNGNNWTPNNISVTAGTTYDSMVDVPIGYGSDTGAGGELRGNYAVFNALDFKGSNAPTLSNANLRINAVSTAAWRASASTIAFSSQKIYCEITISGAGSASGGSRTFGVIAPSTNIGASGVGYASNTGWGIGITTGANDGAWTNGSKTTLTGMTTASGTVYQIAVDGTVGSGSNKIWFGQNGTWFNSGVPSSGTSPVFSNLPSDMQFISAILTDAGYDLDVNFGQRPFSYTAPSGFQALCTQNLPAASIVNGANYMAASLYTGTSASQTVSNAVNGISFQPDLVWAKCRSVATDNVLYDVIRGASSRLFSNLSNAESAGGDGFNSFASNGFNLDSTGSGGNVNTSGRTYVGWQWKGGGTAVSNTAGSITSSVSANTTAGFSVVTYTGTGANATVGHGLGVAPSMIIAKARGTPNGSARSWFVYHVTLGASAFIYLDLTSAAVTGNTSVWQGVTPTSSVFSLGTEPSVNWSASTYVAYCFAPIAGYSAFGSWQNNNSTDGAFIYLGFRPRFILLKNTDNVENWFIWDSSRQTYNVAPPSLNWLQPNTSNAEGTNSANTAEIDGLSNGFKIRTTNPASGEISFGTRTYIYAAFAENPFNISRAR